MFVRLCYLAFAALLAGGLDSVSSYPLTKLISSSYSSYPSNGGLIGSSPSGIIGSNPLGGGMMTSNPLSGGLMSSNPMSGGLMSSNPFGSQMTQQMPISVPMPLGGFFGSNPLGNYLNSPSGSVINPSGGMFNPSNNGVIYPDRTGFYNTINTFNPYNYQPYSSYNPVVRSYPYNPQSTEQPCCDNLMSQPTSGTGQVQIV